MLKNQNPLFGYLYEPVVDGRLNLSNSFNYVRKNTKVW